MKPFFLLLCLAACGNEAPAAPETPASSETAETQAEVRSTTGEIREIEEDRVTIAHEEVPDYMPAMTMPFFLEDSSLAEGLATGDRVEFSFVVRDDGRHILTAVTKL